MKILSKLFWTRPRILNCLHALYLAEPASQTTPVELLVLRKHARGRRVAVEIGTYQGVSGAVIAGAMAEDGVLHCVDPWPRLRRGESPLYRIACRHLERMGVMNKIKILRGYSNEVGHLLPVRIDFAFIDGDHTWSGIDTDWRLIKPLVDMGGVICFHDTSSVPHLERDHDSVRYFNEVILKDPSFRRIDGAESLNVVMRVA